VKGRIHTDKAQVKVNGKDHYVIDSMDSGTKYDLATTFTEHRSEKMCGKHFRKLKDKVGEQIKERWEREKDKPPRERKLITFVSDLSLMDLRATKLALLITSIDLQSLYLAFQLAVRNME
jgi:sulfite reductase alpha subunit-like flavoprotein